MPGGTGERFKKIADELFDGNASELARKMGMTPGAFDKYIKGSTMPGGKILLRLISLDINPTWILTGEGVMYYSQLDRFSELTALESAGLSEIHHRIKWVRLHYRKTISEMATICRTSEETQGNIEKGEKVPWEEYLNRLLHQFEDVRRDWLLENNGPKLNSYSVRQKVRENSEVHEPEHDLFSELESEDLTETEAQILAEVKEFSEFLRTRPLRPVVKRILLQRLIESIDRAVEQLQNTNNPGDQV